MGVSMVWHLWPHPGDTAAIVTLCHVKDLHAVIVCANFLLRLPLPLLLLYQHLSNAQVAHKHSNILNPQLPMRSLKLSSHPHCLQGSACSPVGW